MGGAVTQSGLILLIALLAGITAAGCTWIGFDVYHELAAWRARKRLEAEARALKEAEEAGDRE